jgi:hypothetical protein
MLKKTVSYTLVFMFGFISLIVVAMMALSAPPSMKRSGMISTEQNKTGVVKEAYLVQPDGSFLHEYLCAKNSVFKIEKKQNKTLFVENLEGISAVLEEIVSQGGKVIKQIRSFQAQGGIWDYATQHLRAQKATVSIVESQKTGLKPVFQGHADALDMELSEGKPKFTIEGFRAKLNKDKP